MKKPVLKHITTAFLLLLLFQGVAQTQLPKWPLYPFEANFTGALPTLSSQIAINTPVAVAISSTNLIVTDQSNYIRVVNASTGAVTTLAGNGVAGFTNGTGSAAQFNAPSGLAVDGSGNIFVADKSNHVIRKITSAGVVTTFAGSGVAGFADATGTAAQFSSPVGVSIDGSGNLYIADTGNNRIRKITTAGVVTTIAGSGTAGSANGTGTAAQFNAPTGTTIDASSNIFVADNGNNLIRKITSAGVVTTFAGSGTAGFVNATGTAAQFNSPYDLKVNASGTVYVADKNNNAIRSITSAGVVTTYVGGTLGSADGTGTAAKFNAPNAVALTGTTLYISDQGNNQMRKSAGNVVTSYFISSLYYTVTNAVYENNNVLFSVKDRTMYDKTGTSAGTLSTYTDGNGIGYTTIGPEVSIVPVPGSCRDYYIIYTLYGADISSSDVTHLMYTRISVSVAGVITFVSNGNYVDTDTGQFRAIAISKLVSPSLNTRILYALGYSKLKKYTVSSSGVSAGTTILSSVSVQAREMDLSPDGTKLAFGHYTTNSLYIVDVLTPVLTPITITGGSVVNGVEFSPDNSKIYISANNGLYKHVISGGAQTKLTTSYGSTQLELARDGYIYGIDGTQTIAQLGKINVSTDAVTSAGLANIPYSWTNPGPPYFGYYKLPDQVDGENYDYFFGVPLLTNTFTINGSAVSPTTALNTYTCSTINLANTASSTGATAYQITVNKADASGNVVAGYSYTTGLVGSVPSATIDLKAQDGNYLATNTGYYKIQFYAQNACTSSTYVGLILNSTISAASSNFKLNDGIGGSFTPNNTLPGTSTSAYGASINGSFSTGYIATYQIKVDQVDCSTGAVTTANVVNTPATNVTNGDPNNIVAVSFNSKSSPLGYFSSHAGCFKVTYTVANACGNSSQTGYFNSDPAVYRAGTAIYTDAATYPNPSNGLTTVTFNLQEEKQVRLTMNSLQGGTTYTMFESQSAIIGENEASFDTSTLPAGVYLYQLNDGTNTIQAGKIVVTK